MARLTSGTTSRKHASASSVAERGTQYGQIKIHEGAIATIVRKAACAVPGVTRITGNSFVDNIAEIGLGLNPACMFNGDFEEEKKARGTCHIAMGNGFYYGQPARSTVHIDMVQYNPTVIFDEGTPEEVAACETSYTGRYLKKMLER